MELLWKLQIHLRERKDAGRSPHANGTLDLGGREYIWLPGPGLFICWRGTFSVVTDDIMFRAIFAIHTVNCALHEFQVKERPTTAGGFRHSGYGVFCRFYTLVVTWYGSSAWDR